MKFQANCISIVFILLLFPAYSMAETIEQKVGSVCEAAQADGILDKQSFWNMRNVREDRFQEGVLAFRIERDFKTLYQLTTKKIEMTNKKMTELLCEGLYLTRTEAKYQLEWVDQEYSKIQMENRTHESIVKGGRSKKERESAAESIHYNKNWIKVTGDPRKKALADQMDAIDTHLGLLMNLITDYEDNVVTKEP